MHCAWKFIIVVAFIVGAGFCIYWFVLHSEAEHHDQDQDQDQGQGHGQCQGIHPSKFSDTITVSQSGDGDFYTISDAVNFVPSGNKNWIRIFVHPGIYE